MNYKKYFFVIISFVFLGIFGFFLYNKWIVISCMLPSTRMSSAAHRPIEKKKTILWFCHDNKLIPEEKYIIYTGDRIHYISYVVSYWLNLLVDEEVIKQSCKLQSACLSCENKELILSFDHMPLDQTSSIHDKLLVIESLFKTLEGASIDCQMIRLLKNHQAFTDVHLDFTRSWPLNFFSNKSQAFFSEDYLFIKPQANKAGVPLTIMLDPAGDRETSGRLIDDNFERGLCQQCAQLLKNKIEKQFDDIRVIVTHAPTERLEFLQNASFANRLNVDFYVSINLHQEQSSIPRVFIYYYSSDPVSDYIQVGSNNLYLCAYNDAYRQNIGQSVSGAKMVSAILHNALNNEGWSVGQPVGIPCSRLIGIQKPAIVLDIGLKNKDNLHRITDALAHALTNLLISQ